jgi:hypothetical protein
MPGKHYKKKLTIRLMKIKQPEDIDTFFKTGLNQLPVDFQEKDWQNLSELLDDTNLHTSQIASDKVINAKSIIIAIVLLSLLSLLGWWIYQNTVTKTSVPQEHKIEFKKAVSIDSIQLPSTDSSNKEEVKTPINNDLLREKKNNSIYNKHKSSINSKDTSDNYKHVFW